MDDIQDQRVFIRNSTKKKTIKIPQHRELQPQLLEQDFVRKSTSRPKTSSAQRKREDSDLEPQRKLQSAGSAMKGRLGHLRRAVADAHRKPTSTGKRGVSDTVPIDIEVYLCDKCDRMFCHADEMQKHSSSCEKLI